MSWPVPRPMVRNNTPLGVVAETCAVEIGNKVFFKIMGARHFMALAAFLAQPYGLSNVLRYTRNKKTARNGGFFMRVLNH